MKITNKMIEDVIDGIPYSGYDVKDDSAWWWSIKNNLK